MEIKKEEFWDKEKGISKFIIEYKGHKIIGEAICHPEDKDMQSQLTGSTIAAIRASIELLKFHKNYEVKPALEEARKIYHIFKQKNKDNLNCQEIKILRREVCELEKELIGINKELKQQKKNLAFYIASKDKFYKYIREKRTKGQN